MNTVIVTGAKGNLGSATAAECARRGWNVLGMDMPDVDCTDATAVQSWTREQDLSGLIAVIHTIGGIRAGRSVVDAPFADATEMMTLNYLTTVHIAQAVVPHLEANGGSFVAIGAQTLLKPTAKKGFYAASKAAVAAFVLTMAEEGRTHGLRANVVVPSILRTPQNLEWAEGGEEDTWVTPEQVAVVLASLCDPQNRTSGAVIPVLGGVAL